MEKSKIDPFEVKYMRMIRLSLNTLGQWPNKTFGDTSRKAKLLRAYNYYLIGLWISAQCNVAWYLQKHAQTLSFVEVGHVYTNMILNCLFLQRTSLPLQKKFCQVIKKFAMEFNLMHHAHRSENAAKETRWINKICSVGSQIIQFQLYIGIVSYNFFPFYINYKAGMFSENRPENGTFVHSVDYVVPFDYKTDVTGYWVIFVVNWYPSYMVPSSMCYYDLLMFMLLFHISGHLSILSHSLKIIPRPDGDGLVQSTPEYNKQIFVQLKEVIQHYQLIKEFMLEMSAAFDLTLCFYLAFHQIMCCLVLLECSTLESEALGRYGVLTIVVFQQLIQTSVIFEMIHSKTDKLGDEVYELPWECMDVKNQRIVLVFLRNVQTPLCMKAGGMVPVGVLTMSTILRTSFSYFLMLKTLA